MVRTTRPKIPVHLAFRHGRRLGLALLVLLSVACSEKNEEAPLYNQVHLASWSNTQYVNAVLFHGTEVQNEGSQSCAKCHDIYGQGNENLTGCYACHFGPDGSRVPPGSNWVHGLTRHEELEREQEVCNACHDQERYYGTGPSACHDCHGSGTTHVLGQPWLDSGQAGYHGNQPQQECAACHDLSADCNQCHFGSAGSKSPPGSNWPHGRLDNHNDQKQYDQVCIQCHTLTQAYRNQPDDPHCLACHDD